MNITRKELFKRFYSKRIYFIHERDSFKEEVVNLSTLRELLKVNCRDWEKTPMSYLSSKEALAVGIMLFVKKGYRGHGYTEKAIKLCEYAYMETKDPQLSYLGALALGVLYFENALVQQDSSDREKFFKISTAYLKTASGIAPGDDHSCLYQAIVQRGRGVDLEQVAKTLVRASKVSEAPVPLFKILSNIYVELKMTKAASFYRKKFESEEETPLRLVS